MTEEDARDRATPIHRRHRQAKLETLGKSFWRTWSPENISLLLALYCSVAATGVEYAIWLDDWPDHLFGLQVSNIVAVLLLALAIFNGFLSNSFLASMTPRESVLPKGARWLRLVFSMVPVLGLHAFTFWRSYLKWHQSREQYEATLPRDVLDLNRNPGHLATATCLPGLYRSGFLFLSMALGIIPLVLWAGWLMSADLGSHRRLVLLGWCAFFHILASGLIAHSSLRRIRTSYIPGKRRALYWVVPFLLLLGIPGMIAGWGLYFILETARATLVAALYSHRNGTGRMPLWQSLQGSLHQRWKTIPWFLKWRYSLGGAIGTRESRTTHQVIAFYRLKTLFLVFDGAAFFVIYTRVASLDPSVLLVPLALAGVGLLVQIACLTARVLRIPGSESMAIHPYGRYLLLTQTASVAGLTGAYLVREGRIHQFALFVSLGCLLCVLLSVLFFMPGLSTKGFGTKDLLTWLACFLSWIPLGLLIGLEGPGSQQALAVLGWLTALTPLWSLGLFLALVGWLLRPFSWRDAFNQRLPLRFRWVLASVVVTALLPLGGLAIPFWIYARHRVWPRYEKCLAANPTTPSLPAARPAGTGS